VREFLNAQANIRGPGTAGWWDRVIPELDDTQRESLMEAAKASQISHRAIAVVLGTWGHPVTAAQVGHWRRTHVR
jgi:hypothetical protein